MTATQTRHNKMTNRGITIQSLNMVHLQSTGLQGIPVGYITIQRFNPLSIFMLFFVDIIQLLVVETNRYYHQYLDSPDEGQSPLPDVTLKEMY
jgi:hypothetical protein